MRRDTAEVPAKARAGFGLILLVGLLACGDGDVQGPNEDPENPVLDFSGIVGTWSGWDLVSDGEIWVRMVITGNGQAGEVVGTQVVGVVGSARNVSATSSR